VSVFNIFFLYIDPRTNFRPVVSSNTSGDSSRNEEIDDRCPSTLLKTIPPEAARLKEEVERRKLLWSKKVDDYIKAY